MQRGLEELTEDLAEEQRGLLFWQNVTDRTPGEDAHMERVQQRIEWLQREVSAAKEQDNE